MKKTYIVLVVFLVLSQLILGYIKQNPADIYEKVAQNSFAKNNVEKAIEYSEKAFEHGSENKSLRAKYVDYLTSVSLNLEIQEKMVKFLDYKQEDSSKLRVQHSLYNLRRNVFNKYPENYITKAPTNKKIVRWGKMPITYTFVSDNYDEIPEYFKVEIENAFSEWSKAMKGNISFTRNHEMPNIVINFRTHNPAQKGSNRFIAAYTVPRIVGDELIRVDMDFYLKDSMGNYFSQNYIYNTALHEIAHALGVLGHSVDKKNILYMSSKPEYVFFDKRESLSSADIMTMKLLYDTKPDITNSKALRGKYVSYVVLGDDEDINYVKEREAMNYIKQAPNIPNGYVDMAGVYLAREEYFSAEKMLKKALKYTNDRDSELMIKYNLAICNFYNKQYEIALEYLDEVAKYKSSDENVQHLYAEIYNKNGNPIKAIQLYKNLIASNPDNIDYIISLTNIYITQKQKLKAREVLKEFFQNNPEQKNNPIFKPYGILKLGL